ncbi:hypothetical protein IF1G_05781 [Cordyceps javanica]|uniref:Uncharacterized protein n=1 Tax=Cordyceps javanica TaxID=43265 RepID=A0A545VYQ8_9HYPO|nr:hypothetical protein IF1G_05781 [Cordyceps javanica]TQW06848.1 hypothetical protein IF2G_05232 [Cordyceps javanica]
MAVATRCTIAQQGAGAGGLPTGINVQSANRRGSWCPLLAAVTSHGLVPPSGRITGNAPYSTGPYRYHFQAQCCTIWYRGVLDTNDDDDKWPSDKASARKVWRTSHTLDLPNLAKSGPSPLCILPTSPRVADYNPMHHASGH